MIIINNTLSIPIIVCQQCSGTAIAVAAYISKHKSTTRHGLNQVLSISPKTIEKALLDLALQNALVRNEDNELFLSESLNEKCEIPCSYIDLFFNKKTSSSELKVLCAVMIIQADGNVPTLKSVAEFISMDKSTVSKVLKSLKHKGLVKATACTSAHHVYTVVQ